MVVSMERCNSKPKEAQDFKYINLPFVQSFKPFLKNTPVKTFRNMKRLPNVRFAKFLCTLNTQGIYLYTEKVKRCLFS